MLYITSWIKELENKHKENSETFKRLKNNYRSNGLDSYRIDKEFKEEDDEFTTKKELLTKLNNIVDLDKKYSNAEEKKLRVGEDVKMAYFEAIRAILNNEDADDKINKFESLIKLGE